MIDRREQILGILLGGAIGDALGAPFENHEASATRELPASGDVTDDTQLTLATCEAILEADGVVGLEVIARRYTAWFEQGRVHGIGASTAKALRDLAAGAHWALAGARGDRAAGSGAAMRIGPLAFLVDLTSDADRTLLRDFCRITHHNDEAYAAAVAVVAALHASAAGRRGEALTDAVVAALPDSNVRDRMSGVRELDSPSDAEAASITGTSGYAASVVPFAVHVAASYHDLTQALTHCHLH